MLEWDVELIIVVIGLCLAAAVFIVGILTPGRRALFFGIAGFLVVAVPGWVVVPEWSEWSSVWPGWGSLGGEAGVFTISAGVIGAVIVGAVIGYAIDRRGSLPWR